MGVVYTHGLYVVMDLEIYGRKHGIMNVNIVANAHFVSFFIPSRSSKQLRTGQGSTYEGTGPSSQALS